MSVYSLDMETDPLEPKPPPGVRKCCLAACEWGGRGGGGRGGRLALDYSLACVCQGVALWVWSGLRVCCLDVVKRNTTGLWRALLIREESTMPPSCSWAEHVWFAGGSKDFLLLRRTPEPLSENFFGG